MKMINDNMPLATPIYVKLEGFVWPNDKMFFLLAQEGIFKCRNHPFFKSAVKMKDGIKELESQKSELTLSYPTLPKVLVERVVGFFRLIAEKQNSEAAAIWVWNKQTEQVELIIPDQVANNSGKSASAPHGWPMDVKYTIPLLQPHQLLIGDIHCHVDGGAYASGMDNDDEIHRPGIHIVVGHIADKKPEFFCEAVADGERFSVHDLAAVWEGFDQADTKSVPPEWLDKVKVEEKNCGGFTGGEYWGCGNAKAVEKKDREAVKQALAKFIKDPIPPEMSTVRKALFIATIRMTYLEREKKAKDFLDHWEQIKKGHDHEKLIGKE
jgi:PRTRC genetic system protein A